MKRFDFVFGATAVVLVAAASPVHIAQAACANSIGIPGWARDYAAYRPIDVPAAIDGVQAVCARTEFDRHLRADVGAVIGYKVALTSQAMQRRFNTDRPIWGRLYAGSLSGSGVAKGVAYGTHPRFEADLMVRVRDEAINQATTPDEVLAQLESVIPFIELPDLLVTSPQLLTAHQLTAVNAGARAGVTGRPIAVPASASGRHALEVGLREMRVTMRDGHGKVLSEGRGRDMLGGHPLLSVPWLAQALAREGERLRPGDLVSLGSFSPLMKPEPGLRIWVSYEGLPGAQPVTVTFE